jgi:hypothetical protein
MQFGKLKFLMTDLESNMEINCVDEVLILDKRTQYFIMFRRTSRKRGYLTSSPITALFVAYNTPIENCRNYVYLGVTFSISGSFTEAKNNLYHKGLQAHP